MRTPLRVLLSAAAATLLGDPSAAMARPPVGEVVRKMQSFYNATRDLKGAFKQVYTDTLYQRKRLSYGYLYVKKPGMMRWNYAKPQTTSFIADGKILWVWEPKDKQAFRNPMSASTLSSGLTFLLGSGDLTKEFRIDYASDKADRLGGPQDLVLKLTPLRPTAQYGYLVLVVRASDHAVTESMVVSKHSRNHFLFTQLAFNTGLSATRFRFRPPADARIVDGTKVQPKP